MTTPGPTDTHLIGRTDTQLVGRTAEAMATGRSRLVATAFAIALGFVAVGWRLVDVSLAAPGAEPRLAAAPATLAPVERAPITDRTGLVLATTVRSASLYADPTRVLDPVEVADRLGEVLDELDRARVLERLGRTNRFVWLARGLTPEEVYKINRLGLPGLGFQTEHRRVYPAGRLTAHVVGTTDIDGRGQSGAERAFDVRLGRDGAPVALSLDLGLQGILYDQLAQAMAEYQALGAAGLIQDVHTGEVLAMASLPDFHPANPTAADQRAGFNKATLGVYEMGSTFKIFNTAIALESGTASLASRYDATKPLRVGGHRIDDYHGEYRHMAVWEIFKHSSNIGSARMALAFGDATQRDYLARFGLMTAPAFELKEITRPLLPPRWRKSSTMTVSFGHGMSVSPLQLTTAVAAMVNGGMLIEPTIVKRSGPAPKTRVIGPDTSDALRRLMRLVVVDGTGRRAEAQGWRVGGKTGTAEKSGVGGYSKRRLLSSFVAAFPMDDPQYVVFAMLDEPKGTKETFGRATAGWVAAPIVKGVGERMAPKLGIEPMGAHEPALRAKLDLDRAPGLGVPLARLEEVRE